MLAPRGCSPQKAAFPTSGSKKLRPGRASKLWKGVQNQECFFRQACQRPNGDSGPWPGNESPPWTVNFVSAPQPDGSHQRFLKPQITSAGPISVSSVQASLSGTKTNGIQLSAHSAAQRGCRGRVPAEWMLLLALTASGEGQTHPTGHGVNCRSASVLRKGQRHREEAPWSNSTSPTSFCSHFVSDTTGPSPHCKEICTRPNTTSRCAPIERLPAD